MKIVERRDEATLLPIIEKTVKPGSVIYSDEWKAYSNINSKLGFLHKTVNHFVNFIDKTTGVHTQAIESYWKKTQKVYQGNEGLLKRFAEILS